MKITSYNKNEVESLDDFEGMDYGVDPENMKYVFKAFINYSNPIGSIVREAVSNSYDAHVEANQDKPIEVEIVDGNIFTGESDSIIFRDWGIGFSLDRIKNIYSKFFSSTKRDSNEQIGGYGIGAKAPLAYVSAFTLKTVHEGTAYTYVIHRGEERPRIELIDKEETDRESGSEIIINIEKGDGYKFKMEIRNQLSFFDNIIFKNCQVEPKKCFRGKNFIWVEEDEYNESNQRICMGKVTYTLSSSNIFISSVIEDHIRENYPELNEHIKSSKYKYYYSHDYKNIVLYFDIGDIHVVWNRENIEYTGKTIEAIESKIKDTFDELYDLISKQLSVPYKDWLLSENVANIYSLNIGDNKIQIDRSDNPFTKNLPKFFVTDYKEYLSVFKGVLPSMERYSKVSYGQKESGYVDRAISKEDFLSKTCYLIKDSQSNIKNNYLYEKESLRSINLVKIITFDQFVEKLRFTDEKMGDKYTKKDLKEIYDNEVSFVKSLVSYYDDIEVPQSYIDKVNAENKQKEIDKAEQVPYLYLRLYYDSGSREYTKFSSFEDGSFMAKKYPRTKHTPLVIYDNDKNRIYVERTFKLYRSFYESDNVIAITLNKKHADKIEKLGHENYIRAHKANESKYTRRIFISSYEYSNVEDLKLDVLSWPSFYNKRMFKEDAVDKSLLKKTRQVCLEHRERPDINFISPEKLVKLQKKAGFYLKYPVLKYMYEDTPEEILSQAVKTTKVNPRLYWIKEQKLKKKENEEETDSSS